MTSQRAIVSNEQLLNSLLGELGGGQAEASGLDLQAYLQVVLKYKWGILALTATVALLSTIYVSTLVPLYRAEATLLFDPPSGTNYGTVRDQTAMDAYNSYYRNSQLFKAQQEIMRSRKFATDLVDKTRLWNHDYFKARPGYAGVEPAWKANLKKWLPGWVLEVKRWAPDWALELARNEPEAWNLSAEELKERYRGAAVDAVMTGMSIETDDEIMLIRLGFVSGDPEFAADMANRLADYYIQHDLDMRMEAFSQATAWLTERTFELRENVMQSDLELQAFRERENIVNMEGGTSVLERELEDVFQRLAESRKKTQSLGLVIQRLNSASSSPGQLSGSPELIKYPSVVEALNASVELEKVIDDLSRVYGPKHPKMIEAVNRYERLREKLAAEKMLVQVGVEAELAAAQAEVQALSAEFDQLKHKARETDKKQFQLQSLERNQQADKELYDLFITRFKELSIGSDVSSANARIIDNALVPSAPYWPDKSRLVLLYSAVALFLGVGLAFLREYLDKTIKSPEEVEEKLTVPLLGSLALLDRPGDRGAVPERMFIDRNKSLFAESIRTIRTGIMLSGLDNPYQIIAITSTVPGEGKTTISMNIACALGQLERVLLIDADMRRAALGPHFGFPRNTVGLADVAAGIKPLDECIHHFEEGNIDILPAGTIPPNPQELLSSTRFEEILRAVSGKYDRIVIDTAPTHLVSDPMLVARWASALIYVMRAETTDYHLANTQLRGLERVGKPILGVVLNGVSENRTSYRRYTGYGGRHGRKSYGDYAYSGSGGADFSHPQVRFEDEHAGKTRVRGARSGKVK